MEWNEGKWKTKNEKKLVNILSRFNCEQRINKLCAINVSVCCVIVQNDDYIGSDDIAPMNGVCVDALICLVIIRLALSLTSFHSVLILMMCTENHP